MTLPTDEEIRAAWQSITNDGPGAQTTRALAAMCLTHPVLSTAAKRITAAVRHPDLVPTEAGILAAMTAGLNYGLRIADMRVNKVARERAYGK